VVAAAAGLVVAMGVAGCGGDPSGPLDAGQFRKQADAICKDGNAAIDELAKDFAEGGPTRAQLEAAAPKVPGLMDRELDRLEALEPPADLADDVAAMLAEFRSVVQSMREQGTAFFDRTDEPFAAAYRKAKDLGLDECAH
jgi:hypothetical protein